MKCLVPVAVNRTTMKKFKAKKLIIGVIVTVIALAVLGLIAGFIAGDTHRTYRLKTTEQQRN